MNLKNMQQKKKKKNIEKEFKNINLWMPALKESVLKIKSKIADWDDKIEMLKNELEDLEEEL